MGSLGMPEILLILVIALIVFGPRKLPELGKTLGQSLAQFRRASEDFKRQWEDEVAIERQRIEAPPPLPVEPATYPAADSTAGDDLHTSTREETASVPTASEAPAIAHHEETAAHETKRDWM
jgi:sec-independent protein translocase protein TatA